MRFGMCKKSTDNYKIDRTSRSMLPQVFKRGPKRRSVSASIFPSILGRIWGHILDKFSTFFNVFWHCFSGYDFHVIMLGFLSVCVRLDVPKRRFDCRKTAIFMDLHVLSKLLELSKILLIFIDFWCQFWRIYAYF